MIINIERKEKKSNEMLIFFFKQKTAYEMRISDWSSDVCSSDLVGPDAGSRARRPGKERLMHTRPLGVGRRKRPRIPSSGAGKLHLQVVANWITNSNIGHSSESRSTNASSSRPISARIERARTAEIGRAHVRTQVPKDNIAS